MCIINACLLCLYYSVLTSGMAHSSNTHTHTHTHTHTLYIICVPMCNDNSAFTYVILNIAQKRWPIFNAENYKVDWIQVKTSPNIISSVMVV